ncbi:SAF domain-containing protein [Microbacterium invictum]|uniref:Flagella basal body P-ring formation protein FlgA n=1 Tax=Microbacterium invictum TaxID=515415 RepID=A0ABZ0VCA1_9MICO|nr:SAF domain-containing protein [Microbacterium invictum]WQB69442.1 flagella basal body P-ring formation protein FlgA [Microbacterium invictum]
MTAVDTGRRHRALWADARFLLGILLIVASVAGVWFVVSAARQTVPVFVAARTIVSGEVVSSDDVRVEEVALGVLEGSYLEPSSSEGSLEEGMVATRTIASDELVPRSAVDSADAVRTTTVVLRSSVDVPAAVEAGSVVEVWSAPLVEPGIYDVPRILVADATVASVTRDDSMIGGGAAALEVVIPRADVAAVLEAMSDESALSIVPAVGGAG